MNDDLYAGMPVEDTEGRIGVVQEIQDDAAGTRVVVLRDDGTQQTLLPGMYMVVGDAVHIDEVEEPATIVEEVTFDPAKTQELPLTELGVAAQVQDVAPGEELRIPVVREEVVVRTREVERGGVRVHKRVNEREEVVEQPVIDETVEVERVTIGQVVDIAPEVREEGDTLIIPVMEEVLVVQKQLVLKEEIRVTRRRTEDVEQARILLREEQVTIENLGDRELEI